MSVAPQKFADLVGTTRENIYAAIRNGRLTRGVTKKGPRYCIDVELAKAEWFGRKAPKIEQPESVKDDPPPDTEYIPDIEESQATEKYWKAKSAELKYRRETGDLVEASNVQKVYDNEVVACRTKLLAVVSRMRQRITMDEEGFQLFDELIREALEELGRGSEGRIPGSPGIIGVGY